MPKSKNSKIHSGKGGSKKKNNKNAQAKAKAQQITEDEVEPVQVQEAEVEIEIENVNKVEEEEVSVKVEISEPKDIPKTEEIKPSLDLKTEKEDEDEEQWETQKGKSFSSKMRAIKPKNPWFDKTWSGIKQQNNGERTPSTTAKQKLEVSEDKTPTTLCKKGPAAVSTPIEVAIDKLLIEKEKRLSLSSSDDTKKNTLAETSRNNESSPASSINPANKTIGQTDQSFQTKSSTTVNNSTSAAIDDDEGVDVSAGDSNLKDANNNTSKDTSMGPEYVTMKHPLRYNWTLWHLGTKDPDWTKNLKAVATVSTVEDFWSLYHYTKNPSQLKSKQDYSFFRSGIKPTWEAEENKNGGRFLFGQDSQYREMINRKWLEILLYLIGDQASARHGNDRFSELICGVVLNIRKDCDKISLWMGVVLDEIRRRQDDNKDKKAIELVGADFWDCMNGSDWMFKTHPGREIMVTFETHKDSQNKTGRIKDKSRLKINKQDRDAIRQGY